MLQTFKNGQGSVIVRAKLLDSSSTVGAGLTGLSSASSGLIISTIADVEATATAYTVAGSLVETITTLGTYAAPTATKCRFKEVDSTNHKGLYEFHFADARFAVSNAKSLIVSVLGATNLAQNDFLIQLQSDDPYVAKPSNSNLLSIDSNGRIDVIKVAGTSQTAGDIIGDTNDIQARLPAALTGDGNMKADTLRVGGTLQTAGDLAALIVIIDTVVDAILADTGTDGVVLSAATLNAIADAWLDRNMATGTDSGSTTVRTPRQAMRALRNKVSISAGTLTVTKEDDSTASFTAAVTTDAAAEPITAVDPAGP